MGAVVVAYLYGIPFDTAPVRAAAGAVGAWLIEDAAQGAGASFRGRALGAFGDLSMLSFGRGKGVTAGRGGYGGHGRDTYRHCDQRRVTVRARPPRSASWRRRRSRTDCARRSSGTADG